MEMDMVMNRMTIGLSDFQERKLVLWAKIHGRPKAAFASQLIGQQIETNLHLVENMMLDIARYHGISVEELEKQWLAEEGYPDLPED